MEAPSRSTPQPHPVSLKRTTEVVLLIPLFILLSYMSYLLSFYLTPSPYILFPIITIAFIFATIKGTLLHAYSRILLVIIVLLDLAVLVAFAYIIYGFIRDTQGDICTYTFFTSSIVSCVEYHTITVFWLIALYGLIPIAFLMLIGALAQFFTLRRHATSQTQIKKTLL